jgi:hypothetical protein
MVAATEAHTPCQGRETGIACDPEPHGRSIPGGRFLHRCPRARRGGVFAVAPGTS